MNSSDPDASSLKTSSQTQAAGTPTPERSSSQGRPCRESCESEFSSRLIRPATMNERLRDCDTYEEKSRLLRDIIDNNLKVAAQWARTIRQRVEAL
ncbi:MAG TPA: hypothetical protein ENJ19_03175 [Gammaproteobacteria bacterium]|nr:hypothetical protein [Gammaproteobacteria bacterium]